MGLCPNPTLTCEAAGAGGKPYPTYPYGECWVDSKASRVKCTTSSPLTPLHLRGVAKLTEADGLETCQGLRSNRVATALYRLEATTLCGKGAGGFPAPLPRGERGVGSAHGVGKTLGVAQ